MKLNMTCPDDVIRAIDHHVDGVTFRNRAHLITFILQNWAFENRGRIGGKWDVNRLSEHEQVMIAKLRDAVAELGFDSDFNIPNFILGDFLASCLWAVIKTQYAIEAYEAKSKETNQ